MADVTPPKAYTILCDDGALRLHGMIRAVFVYESDAAHRVQACDDHECGPHRVATMVPAEVVRGLVALLVKFRDESSRMNGEGNGLECAWHGGPCKDGRDPNGDEMCTACAIRAALLEVTGG